ncbi:hypothetical protein KEM60_02231 [Austwickia sp. TVS 96-490-7B]|uniref:hypothetical protein n=1 Tax=Austwickia sp. TVS 96-490-7B TaxID=2830843 RepID=UPI001C582583|nr:hypothetical protein [Austwickia sp. TVS 96-490-7B]MBW3086020.1 hypothetical protein [Austwickia sp. TVS 96-490-7B]
MTHSHRESDLLDQTDTAILDALRHSCERGDPLPRGMTTRIAYRMTLAGLHAELAELQEGTLSSLRSSGSDNPTCTDTATFRGSAVSLMIRVRRQDLLDDDLRLDVECWVSIPGTRVELWLDDSHPRALDADPDGRLTFTNVLPGAARFVIRPDNSPPVTTPTVQL